MAKKRSASKRGSLSRNKGKVFERKVASDLRGVYGQQVKRGWQAREGHDAPDVENVPFWVECKHHQHVSIQAALKQAHADAKAAGSKLPILVVAKDNRGEPLAVLEWQTLVALLKTLRDTDDEPAPAEPPPPLMVVEEDKAPTQFREVEVFKPAQPSAD